MSPSVEFSLFFIFFYYFSIQIHNSFVYITDISLINKLRESKNLLIVSIEYDTIKENILPCRKATRPPTGTVAPKEILAIYK